MNKHTHRLVFDRKRGMRVPAAEHARSAGKAAGGQTRSATACVVGVAVAGALSLGPAEIDARTLEGGVPRAAAGQVSRQGGQAWVNRTNPGSNLPVRSTLGTRIATDSAEGSAFKLGLENEGRTLLIDQFDRKITINWDSFNVAPGYGVRFNQPVDGTAYNKIWDMNPTVILGSVQASGEIILETQNGGIIFGSGARVDAQRVVASALALTSAWTTGLRKENKDRELSDSLVFDGSSADTSAYYRHGHAQGLVRGVVVEPGAQIRALAGGDVILVGPSVYNGGRIETPDGQTVMAAGQRVYMMSASADPTQRGLVVAVDAHAERIINEIDAQGQRVTTEDENGVKTTVTRTETINGTVNVVENAGREVPGGLRGTVEARRGLINLVGMVVRQNGVLTATTAVKGDNGVITLEAASGAQFMEQSWAGGVNPEGQATATTSVFRPLGNQMGTLTFGAESITSIAPDGPRAPTQAPAREGFASGEQGDKAFNEAKAAYEAVTQSDSELFLRSRISGLGKDVTVQAGASLLAPAGNLELFALSQARDGNISYLINPAQGSAPLADDSKLTIEAGATLSVAGLRDVVLPTLRNQLSGRLFSNELADSPVQRNGVLYRQAFKGDATAALGVANVKGFYDTIRRDAHEWMTVGGNITLATQGQLKLDVGSQVDVSGGSVKYEAGTVGTTLLRKGSRIVSLADADAGVRYDELIVSADGDGRFVPEFVQGFDAGALTLSGAAGMNVSLAGVKGDVVNGSTQRNGKTATQLAGGRAAYTQPTGGRAIGRPTALKDSPHLYTSIRPQAFTLNLGQQVGQDRVPTLMRGLTLGSLAQAPEPVGDRVDLSELRSQMGVLQASAKLLAVAPEAGIPMAPGASVTLESQERLTFAGRIDAPSVDVSLTSSQKDVLLTRTAVLDLSGDQFDLMRRGTVAPQLTSTDGGSLTLNAGTSVTQERGSRVDLSAGLVRASTGSEDKGGAGQLSVGLNRFATLSKGEITLAGAWTMAGSLRAFDFDKGGKLTVSGLRTLSLQGSGNLASGNKDLALQASFFSDHGFGGFDFKSVGDVTIADGLNLKPQLRNLTSLYRGGAGAITTEVVLDEKLRAGVNLSLAAQAKPAFAQRSSGGVYAGMTEAANVKVGKNSIVDVGDGGKIGLSAAGNVDIAGELVARGGEVNLAISGARGGGSTTSPGGGGDTVGYLPDQAITLRSTGKINVSGIDRTFVLGNGRSAGRVFGGGTVNINGASGPNAVRGKVLTEVGSSISLDGATGTLSFGRGLSTQIAAGAGSLSIESADGLLLQGEVSAKRPNESVGGGSLYVSLSREGSSDLYEKALDSQGNELSQSHLKGERSLVVKATPAAKLSDESTEGRGVLSADLVNTSGFDQVHLRSEGRVLLQSGVSLGGNASTTPLRSISIDSPVLELKGSDTHVVQATRVSLGDASNPLLADQVAATRPAPTPTLGTATLQVNAGLIEVHGHSALQGVDATRLNATLGSNHQADARTDGEVRFVGRTYGNSSAKLEGSLNFAGDLFVRAGQTYATTLSQFDVKGSDVQEGESIRRSHFQVQAPTQGSSSRTPLSALAHLKVNAHDITVNGVMRQPFGAISLVAVNKPELSSSSLLSVSGEGVVVPVGSTINQSTWVYSPQGLAPNEGASIADPTQVQQLGSANLLKGILIEGGQVKIDSQSRIEAQAGGDLLTWEFLAGVMGSKNTLARQGVYAILPDYTHDFAPHDTEILASQAKAGTTLSAGQRITLNHDITQTDANGNQILLAKGTYTLLPAQYGVLPGALLVSAIGNGTGAPLQNAIQQDDGGVRVGGYFTAAGTAINGGNDTRLAFLVEPEGTFRQQSDLSLTSVSSLLSRNAAKRNLAAPTLPGDAGRVSLWSRSGGFDWAARYNLAGGQLDLAMAGDMTLVADVGVKADDGVHQVSATQLASTQAASVLLGGVRDGNTTDVKVTQVANNVSVNTDYGVARAAGQPGTGELILAAKDAVKVADGKTIQATRADTGRENNITFQGSGSALVVSHLAETKVTRVLGKQTGDAADQVVLRSAEGSGAILRGAAIDIDSTGVVQGLEKTARSEQERGNTGATVVETRRLGLGAKDILVGEGSGTAGLTADATLADRERLTLRTPGSITLQGGQTLGGSGMQRLVLDAPTLVGRGADTDVARVTAQQVVLRNSSGATPSSLIEGSGKLLIDATPPVRDATADGIRIESGQQRLAFSEATLKTTGDIVFDGQGELRAQKDLTLSAARVTAETGSKHGVDAAGRLTIESAVNGRTLGNVVGTGAQLALKGQVIAQKGRIELTSGRIELTSKTGVELATDSKTSAAGALIKQGDRAVAASGGGEVTIRAQDGTVLLDGEVDVSAATGSGLSQVGVAAGNIHIESLGSGAGKGLTLATNAKLTGKADQASQSGRLDVEVSKLTTRGAAGDVVGSLDRLAELAEQGGIQREVSVRTTEGSLELNRKLSAGRVQLIADDRTADEGNLTLGAQALIDTTAAAERGGVVMLAAQNRLALKAVNGQGATIKAGATVANANGGDVLINSAQGVIQTDADTLIDAGTGRVVLRTQLNDAGTALRTLPVEGQAAELTRVQGRMLAGEVSHEAVKVAQTTGDLTLNAATLTALSNAAKAFYDNSAAGVRNSLNLAAGSALQVRYGHEIRSTGDMTLAADWNLYTAGRKSFDLTLRSGGNLALNGHLSDGFTAAGPVADTATTPSAMVAAYKAASMRLVAGADANSAQVMRTVDPSRLTAEQAQVHKGQLSVAGDKVIRTTDGSIELASSRDFVLQASGTNDATRKQAAVYVAGRPVTANDLANETSTATSKSVWQRFTQQGGRLELHARGDVKAPVASQGFGNWLLHTGTSNAAEVAWASDFDAFRQGLGSMGGGDVRVVAGGEVRNLGVAAPTSARTYKDTASNASKQWVQNGGNVTVRAGGNIAGGMYLLGRGDGALEAGGAITVGDARAEKIGVSSTFQAMAPVLGLMEGQWRLQAQGDVQVSAVYNPTALAGESSSTRTGAANANKARAFVTYSDDAAVAMTSSAGGVAWRGDLLQALSASGVVQAESGLLNLHTRFGPLRDRLTVSASSGDARAALQLLPATLEVTALGRLQDQDRHPDTSVAFDLPLNDLVLSPSKQGQFRVHGERGVNLATASSGSRNIAMLDFNPRAGRGSVALPVAGSVSWPVGNATPSAGLHVNSRDPAVVTSGGDIDFRSTKLNMPKALEVVAAGNILNPSVKIQHNGAQDISRIVAGGTLIGAENGLNPSRPLGLMQLNGPGELQVEAGLTLDLGTAGGIEATGADASIRVASGMRKQVNVDELVNQFLNPDEQARAALIQHVQEQLRVSGLTYEQALALYREMTPAHQSDFAMKKLVLPKFAREYVQGQGSNSDVVWAWVARAAGVSVSDAASPLFAEYQSAQRTLVSYVQGRQGTSGLTFEQALASYRAMSNADKATLVDKRRTLSPIMAMAFLAAEPTTQYASEWQQVASAKGAKVDDFTSATFQRFMEGVLLREIQRIGSVATAVADSSNELFNARRAATRDAIWAQVAQMATASGFNQGFEFQGDTDLSRSKVHLTGDSSVGSSSIDMFAPGGGVLVGTVTATAFDAAQAGIRGLATYGGGDVRSYSKGDFQVASQKVHIVGSGDIMLYSSEGDIDSGRGSNNAVTVPPKVAVADAFGTRRWKAGKSTVGSGMAIFVDADGRREGKISLLAPRGEVKALDAFIDAPSIELAGPVIGGDNLQGAVAGSTPPPPPAVPVAVNAGLGSETAAGQAEKTLAAQQAKPKEPTSMVTVDVLGLGGDGSATAAGGASDQKDEARKNKERE